MFIDHFALGMRIPKENMDIGPKGCMEKLLSGVPVVLANGKLDLPNAYSVTVDDKYGVSLAVEHLAEKGRQNIYYIKDRDTDSAKAKRDGFLEAMRRHGLAFADHVLEAGETLEDAVNATQALLAQGIVPDGIVCGEDLTAAGALKALLRAGLRVPGQVAVVGFNNSDYAHLCEPVLTSVDNKPEQVALLCVQLLESSIERSEAYSSVVLQPELAQGETS